ncbi:hypothetical protein [Streptomyces lincolnensis]|uniref:hypothetical protein n=1 Tax=Streptomyces lincolnensis TaxID=1915 RepID=UPI001E4A0A76|nr:hypothetical protein [Streptomyces lincolnensis]
MAAVPVTKTSGATSISKSRWSLRPVYVATVRRVRILLAAGLNTDLIREVLPCMTDDGAILAPTCEEMAQDLTHERERLSRSIEQLQAAHAMLSSIIHAGEALTTGGGRSG